VWYHLGNNFLSDDLRGDALLEHVMRLTKTELSSSAESPEFDHVDDYDVAASFQTRMMDAGASSSGMLDVEGCGELEEEGESYSVCTHEAVLCYQRALGVLDRSPQTGRLRDHSVPPALAELYTSIYCRLADCYVLSHQLDRAVVTYERALPYFERAASGGSADRRRKLLRLNAHALSTLATVNFLLHNFWRATVIYETAMLLLHHQLHKGDYDDDDDQVSVEGAWVGTMYALTFAALGRDHQCVVWALRAFAAYVRVLRGKILDVDALRRWFVVETLYILARAYSAGMEDGAVKAVHYLTIAKNLATAASEHDVDYPQTIEV